MQRPDKAAKMIDYLEERLVSGYYSSGDRLPSVRSLMRRFDLSYGTVRRGIDYLNRRSNIVEKIPSRGIYFKALPETTLPQKHVKLAVFVRTNKSDNGMYYTAFKAVSELAATAEYSVKSVPLDIGSATPLAINRESEGCDGIIFLQEYDAAIQSLRVTIPAVGIMIENCYNGGISTVNLDFWSAAEIAVEYFMSHGIRRVVISGSREPVFAKRGQMFAMMWKEYGFKCSFVDTGAPIKFRKGTGYLFTSDNMAHFRSMDYQKLTGRQLAMDHVIMGMDGKQLMIPEFHHFPTVAVNWQNIGAVAFEECAARIRNPALPPKRIYIKGRFVEPKI